VVELIAQSAQIRSQNQVTTYLLPKPIIEHEDDMLKIGSKRGGKA